MMPVITTEEQYDRVILYDRAFETERKNNYPHVSYYEEHHGFAINKDKLENAARYLACPLKVNPPCWQHGRIIYTTLRSYFARQVSDDFTLLDVGTAKGFSALCALWALHGAQRAGIVSSVDVIDPEERTFRNTVLDTNGPKTLHEMLVSWPEASSIKFSQKTGVDWIRDHTGRVHFAFLDGKHTEQVVRLELMLLTPRQERGDIVILDDVQIPGVAKAMSLLTKSYRFQTIVAIPGKRAYAVGEKR